MKYIFFITICINLYSNQKIDEIFKALENQKDSNISNEIDKLQNSFYDESLDDKIEKDGFRKLNDKNSSTLTKDDLKLYAIFNKRAKINSKWYKKDENISNVVIKKITDKKVFFENNLTLELNSNKKVIIRRIDENR